MDLHTAKAIATAAAAAVCSVSLYKTDGQSGIGWFLVCLIVIW